ncbi:MAG TPA: hypothetical protein PK708_01180 [Candidatus Competibacter sp.]|nr:hypothetical protein [Candidatus Competibacter sp.]
MNRREKQDEIATRSIRNPGGRKPGAGKAEKLRAALIKELPEALEAQAKTGDTGAIKLVLERTVPELRPVDAATPLNLPAAGSLADQDRVVMAVGSSTWSPIRTNPSKRRWPGKGSFPARRTMSWYTPVSRTSENPSNEMLAARVKKLEAA